MPTIKARSWRVREPLAENKVKFHHFGRIIHTDAHAVGLSLNLEGEPIEVQEGYRQDNGRFRVTHRIVVRAEAQDG